MDRRVRQLFDYEDVEEDKKVKLAVTRLKGHATLWWDSVQAKRKKKNKVVIKSWDRMVAKMRANSYPRTISWVLDAKSKTKNANFVRVYRRVL